jgi:hypothetical protein
VTLRFDPPVEPLDVELAIDGGPMLVVQLTDLQTPDDVVQEYLAAVRRIEHPRSKPGRFGPNPDERRKEAKPRVRKRPPRRPPGAP